MPRVKPLVKPVETREDRDIKHSEAICKVVKRKLTEQGMTQGELAKKIGLFESALSFRLGGKYIWKSNDLNETARVLHFTSADFAEIYGVR